MGTHIENYLSLLEKTRSDTVRLGISGYQESSLRELINKIGFQTELFLKNAVLPHLPPKTDFDGCINALKRTGISKPERDILHAFRQMYNDSKHTVGYHPSLLQLEALLPKVGAVFRGLAERNIGVLNKPDRFYRTHVFWLAVWDHFAGGDSEVHIIVPTTSGWPPDLDLIYVDISSWDEIKQQLSTAGTVRPGKNLIPDQYYAEFEEESDFHEAIVVETSYRTVMAILAAHERREDLIPGLRREDDMRSMVQAFSLAAIDIATEPELPEGERSKAIAERAVATYAVPETFQLLSRLAAEFGTMIAQVPKDRRQLLTGPVWVGKEQFRALAESAIARHPSLGIIVDDKATVILKL